MEERRVADVTVDLCPACQGLWIDWLDGDTTTLVAKLAPLPFAKRALEPRANPACPRCLRPLGATARDGETEGRARARVLRCGECAGTFIPRTAFDEVLERPTQEPPSPPEPLVSKLAAVLRQLVATLTYTPRSRGGTGS
jgi:Zn-finger nucleic acid-binding protein